VVRPGASNQRPVDIEQHQGRRGRNQIFIVPYGHY
jgi:hypothetical protein